MARTALARARPIGTRKKPKRRTKTHVADAGVPVLPQGRVSNVLDCGLNAAEGPSPQHTGFLTRRVGFGQFEIEMPARVANQRKGSFGT